MSAATQNSAYSITMSPPPPFDLGTYSRSMHQHTKRQMEAASQTNLPRSSNSSSPSNQSSSSQSQSNATPSLPNGVSGTRSRNHSDYSYQS
ncbi:hypothetical protein B0T20DRAFT_342544 [Sordaria brevicollis]|uniref:Uncharacterized protein n=1 Tax=Sordaria brevicollis TaxID=83679 RepID=A0AAE0UGE0_SORBR|nr:hypothetical protein B0T20DRAFT_342544 [Sordaria brevicollis]